MDKKLCAISACLLGYNCRYDGGNRRDDRVIELLSEDYNLIPFCPEDATLGTPRPTIDLIKIDNRGEKSGLAEVRAIVNSTKEDVTNKILNYSRDFFNKYPNIKLFVGKDKSPSCGVATARIYSKNGELINKNGTGLMAKEAIEREITSFDATNLNYT
jgi:uncharacterized protein YbbK (DUF523 family)